MHKAQFASVLGLSAILAGPIPFGGSASAQNESGEATLQEVVDQVAEAIGDVLGQDGLVTPLMSAQSDGLVASTEDITVVLGADSSDGLELTHESGVSLTVDLPNSSGDAAAALDGATVVYAEKGEPTAICRATPDRRGNQGPCDHPGNRSEHRGCVSNQLGIGFDRPRPERDGRRLCGDH